MGKGSSSIRNVTSLPPQLKSNYQRQ